MVLQIKLKTESKVAGKPRVATSAPLGGMNARFQGKFGGKAQPAKAPVRQNLAVKVETQAKLGGSRPAAAATARRSGYGQPTGIRPTAAKPQAARAMPVKVTKTMAVQLVPQAKNSAKPGVKSKLGGVKQKIAVRPQLGGKVAAPNPYFSKKQQGAIQPQLGKAAAATAANARRSGYGQPAGSKPAVVRAPLKSKIAVRLVPKAKMAVRPSAKVKAVKQKIAVRPQLGGKAVTAGLSKAEEATKEKIKALDPSLKCWIGGLPEGVTWKQIQTHFAQMCSKPNLVDLMKRGTACVSFKTEDEVQTAIAVVNGTDLAGAAIEVDAWTQRERREKTPGQLKSGTKTKAGQQAKKVIVKTITKTIAVPTKLSKVAEKINGIDASLKCWISGLAEGTSWKAVKEHFESVGEIEAADLLKNPKNAVVAFKSEEDVATAIATLNGSELNGAMIEVDEWTKPTRKERPEASVKPAKIVIKTQFAKQGVVKNKLIARAKAPAAKVAAKSDAQSKVAEKLRGIDRSFKCWIGGLAEGTTWVDVKKHFQPYGAVDAVDLLKKGKAVVAFKDADNVAEAVAILNGSDLKGASIQVDFWTMSDRKGKADA